MGTKILIVEDEPNIAETLADILEITGYETTTAINGQDGLDQVRYVQPDLVLCDVMMPVMDGYAMLKNLRNQEDTKHIPFVFLTAKDRSSDFRRGMNIGAQDYLVKPIDADTLLKTIARILEEQSNLLESGRREEKERISSDLHDTLQQYLLGIKIKLTHYREKAPSAPRINLIDESIEMVEQALKQIRIIIHEEDKINKKEESNLGENMIDLTKMINSYSDFDIQLENQITSHPDPKIASTIFKLTHEILNNAIKYAAAKTIKIDLLEDVENYEIIVYDDGVGFDINETTPGNGLKNMEKRVNSLNGRLIIRSEIGSGTCIIIQIPK